MQQMKKLQMKSLKTQIDIGAAGGKLWPMGWEACRYRVKRSIWNRLGSTVFALKSLHVKYEELIDKMRVDL